MLGFVRVLLVAGTALLAGASGGAMADPINGQGNGYGIGNGNAYGQDNGTNGNGNRGAPLPVVGAGLPILVAAGIYYALRRRRGA